VRIFSFMALILFLMLVNPMYWERIGSLTKRGAEVEGVDTGSSRLVLAEAQWRMFETHPLGCGHRCTAVLSPSYLDDEYLTGEGADRARSSHSTVMTMLVEHGLPGAFFYAAMLVWILVKVSALKKSFRHSDGFLQRLFPGVVASIAAILVGDLFVDYIRFEARFWFLGLLVVMGNLAQYTAGDVSAAVVGGHNNDEGVELR
jgi:O-antigen ligase